MLCFKFINLQVKLVKMFADCRKKQKDDLAQIWYIICAKSSFCFRILLDFPFSSTKRQTLGTHKVYYLQVKIHDQN